MNEGAEQSGWALATTTDSARATQALGERLARQSRPGDVVLLIGALGAGKTTLAQGFARGLGVVGPVTSPTFTLIRQYSCAEIDGVTQFLHADLYRLESMAEVIDLALPELVEDEGVALVEWGDLGAAVLGENTLTITLVSSPDRPDEVRAVHLCGSGPLWADRRDAVALATGVGP